MNWTPGKTPPKAGWYLVTIEHAVTAEAFPGGGHGEVRRLHYTEVWWRGYLSGHAWSDVPKGYRVIAWAEMPAPGRRRLVGGTVSPWPLLIDTNLALHADGRVRHRDCSQAPGTPLSEHWTWRQYPDDVRRAALQADNDTRFADYRRGHGSCYGAIVGWTIW